VSRFSKLIVAPKANLGLYETIPKVSFHSSNKIFFSLSDPHFSAMSKKKKRQDPGQLKAKEEKRRRKLAKALRKMEKKDRQAKPLSECEVPLTLHKEAKERTREMMVTEEVMEERIHLMKEWSRFAYIRHRNELWKQDTIMQSQQVALDELKKESELLYRHAIEFDPSIIPVTFKGPVKTPPIKDYLQDGEYKETTQSFKVIYEDTDAFMKTLLSRNRPRKKRASEEED